MDIRLATAEEIDRSLALGEPGDIPPKYVAKDNGVTGYGETAAEATVNCIKGQSFRARTRAT